MPLIYNAVTDQYKYIFLSNLGISEPLLRVVSDIARLNSLSDHSGIVKVVDATGDPSVLSGAAYYTYIDGVGWDKIAEKESMDIDAAYFHTHSNFDLLNTYSFTNSDAISAIAQRHSHLNINTLSKFSHSETGEVLFNGVVINNSIENAPVELIYYSFDFDNTESSLITFTLADLEIPFGTGISVWKVNEDNSIEKICPDITYTETTVIVDLNGFPSGLYQLTYLRNNGDVEGLIRQVTDFVLNAEDTTRTFNFHDLNIAYRVDPTIYRVLENGNEEKVNMTCTWTTTNTLVLDTAGFGAGNYRIRYFSVNPTTIDAANTTTYGVMRYATEAEAIAASAADLAISPATLEAVLDNKNFSVDVTTEQIQTALGISAEGSSSSFLNEQGNFVAVATGLPIIADTAGYTNSTYGNVHYLNTDEGIAAFGYQGTPWIRLDLMLVTSNASYTGDIVLQIGSQTKVCAVTTTPTWVSWIFDTPVSGLVELTRLTDNENDTLKDGSSVIVTAWLIDWRRF